MPPLRSLLLLALASLLGTPSTAQVPWLDEEQLAALPNVVLLMADDMGWGDAGYMGHEVLRTPHLDAMAAGGLRFERFYAASPACSPTRASLLTGRHGHRHGVEGSGIGILRRRETTVGELFAEVGYATGHFGKWHVGSLLSTAEPQHEREAYGHEGTPSAPWHHGFQTNFSTKANVPTWDPMLEPVGNEEKRTWRALADRAASQPFGMSYWRGPDERVPEDELLGDDSRLMMDQLLAFAREQAESETPFLAVVWFHAPHSPVVAGPEDLALYAEASDDLRTQSYWATLTAMDREIGRLRAALRELAIEDDTLLWFCADNGPADRLDGPGVTGGLRGRKGSLFEGGIRVPAVMEWPGVVGAGTSCPTPVSTSDMLPTVLDLAGLGYPLSRPLDGISIAEHVAEGGAFERPPIYFEFLDERAVIDGRFKLLRYAQAHAEGPQTMLYDLETDPGEEHNLAPRYGRRAGRLWEGYLRWRRSVSRSAEGRDY